MGTRILNSGGKNVGAKFVRFVTVGILGEALIAAGTVTVSGGQGLAAGRNLARALAAPGGKEHKSFLLRCAEELVSAVAGVLPGGSGVAYTGERIMESRRGNTSDVAGQFNIGGVVTSRITTSSKL